MKIEMFSGPGRPFVFVAGLFTNHVTIDTKKEGERNEQSGRVCSQPFARLGTSSLGSQPTTLFCF